MLVSPHGIQPVSIDRPESRNLDGIMMLLGQALTLQLRGPGMSESMDHHDSEIMDDWSIN
jgi:hypothetical protein